MSDKPPAQKSMDFVGSGKRLLGVLRPERLKLALILLLTVISVGMTVLGPKVLGNATNLIFEGVIGRQLPAGGTQERSEEHTSELQSRGHLVCRLLLAIEK